MSKRRQTAQRPTRHLQGECYFAISDSLIPKLFIGTKQADRITHCDVCALMATAGHHLDIATAARGVHIEAKVGAATWEIDVDHPTLLALGSPAGQLEPAAIQRVMENVRAKAVATRWYGGGRLSLDPCELKLSAPEPIRLEDGTGLPSKPWYKVVKIVALPHGARKLSAVG